jgi:hypothetical protein
MARKAHSTPLQTINFIIGCALLAMLFPIGGKLPEKPAGVRTAIETIAKKPALKAVPSETAAAI